MKRLLAMLALAACSVTHAADAPACRVVRMADPGWTDIAGTNALAGIVLEALGYEQRILPLSVPITYAGLQKGQVDVFLGNWMPAQRALVEPLFQSGAVEQVHANLPAAKFTLAVPDYVAQAGVRTFADLATFADRFDRRIYGIEAGSPANQTVKKMLAAQSYGLEHWILVESSEQGMLSQVKRVTRNRRWIVFLAWEPHQMNNAFRITYLDGDKDYFGPNFGSASVNTVTRRGYRSACPNAGRLAAQLTFSPALEHAIIADVVGRRQPVRAAALRQLQAHPELLDTWLEGVTTLAGTNAKAAVLARLGANNL
ncbi:glycine betaine/proline transport system substrate-binding protein [Pseudoduganella lurida]|uniref:Glycine betaine/proline transport system substrate-binding protein n=1 Tax=Pseudoduganella lurida TaxID=1036180 RepID=A0A562QWJ2_9BURK|nr:choline ABC transporter substrate-binding protein [Pseudoduganella lurida]TWI61169.1 glycine betaine/proline transport system substrate-binding protein [Pseudoduganella lurida]